MPVCSAAFSLPDRERVLLRIEPGNTTRHDGGGLLTLMGGLSTAGGAVTTLAANGNQGTTVAGLAFLGVGVLALAIGIPLLLSSATTVRFE